MLNNQIGMIERFMSWKWFLLIHRYSNAEEYLQKTFLPGKKNYFVNKDNIPTIWFCSLYIEHKKKI